jgi:two-component system nitrate/nitrite sensor histidine kinase NarX
MPHQGQHRTAASHVADKPSGARPSAPVVRGGNGDATRVDAPAPELEAALSPMLEAVVGIAGATAGTVRVVGQDGVRLEPGVAVGLPAGMGHSGAGALAFWCSRCAEARNPDADCVKSRLCGVEERFSVDLSGPACRHVVAVPLRFRGAPVGTLDLLFEAECALPPETMPLLRATGELIGVALENARLTRENLRASLTQERQLMANEVHDSLAQGLTYMRMRMSLLRDAIKNGDELRTFKYWSDVDDSLTHAHRRLRELITYFRSRMDPQGLQHALAETAASFLDRTGVALAFENGVPELQLPVGREVEVFHIVQEALANVCKHAGARHARLALGRTDGGYEIVVEDDGVGVPADNGSGDHGEAGHYGIAIMRERARRLGGELTMEAAGATGTRVRLRIPAVQPQSESRL